MSKVVLFKGAARYDAANRYIDELAEGLRALGREVVVLHEAEPGFGERLLHELDFRCEFAAGFDGAGALVEGPDPFIVRDIPRIHLLLEHPVHRWPQFQLGHHQWAAADRRAIPFVERAFGGARTLHFLPMGGTPPAGGVDGERRGVVFAGSYEDPEGIMARWRRHFSTDLAELLQLMAAHAVANPHKPLLTAVEEAFAANDFPEGEELLRRFVPAAYAEVDRAVRNYRRYFLLQVLDEAGIAVELYGTGWRAGCFERHRDHGPIPYHEVLERYREAAVVLDISSHLEDGPHERMLTAMAHGAAVVAGGNPWIRRHFDVDRDLIGYTWDALERLPEELAMLLENPARRAAMAERGRREVIAGHTWRHRARELLERVAESRAAA